MKVQQTDKGIVIDFEQALMLDSLQENLKIICRLLTDSQFVTLQTRELSHIDSAGLQFLLALIIHLKQRGICYQWEAVSPIMFKMAKLSGLQHDFGL